MNQWMSFYLIFFLANAVLGLWNVLNDTGWVVCIARIVLVIYSVIGFIYEWRKKDEYL